MLNLFAAGLVSGAHTGVGVQERVRSRERSTPDPTLNTTMGCCESGHMDRAEVDPVVSLLRYPILKDEMNPKRV